jgi:hypothetical protein
MSKENNDLIVKNQLTKLGLYFTDLKQALEPLKKLLNDETSIDNEIKTRKKASISSYGLKPLQNSLIDFGLNLQDFQKEIKNLKEVIEAIDKI